MGLITDYTLGIVFSLHAFPIHCLDFTYTLHSSKAKIAILFVSCFGEDGGRQSTMHSDTAWQCLLCHLQKELPISTIGTYSVEPYAHTRVTDVLISGSDSGFQIFESNIL